MKPRKLLPYLNLCTELAVRAVERIEDPQRSDALADIAALSTRLTRRQPKSGRITKKEVRAQFDLIQTTYPALAGVNDLTKPVEDPQPV